MARRKWRMSDFVCADIGQVIDSCTAFGGVWRCDVQRFANRAWVMSQQLHYLLERTRLGVYYYPEPIGYAERVDKATGGNEWLAGK